MNNILVPTDFSPTATKALQFALLLARHTGGSILLCHVFTPVESTFIDTEEKRRQHNEATRSQCFEQLEALRASVAAEAEGLTINTCVERTPLVGNLIKSAQEHNCQLIVMGTHGATGMKKMVIGSVASEVAEESSLPVLLVPEQHLVQSPGKMVFATTFRQQEAGALEQTITLAQACKASLTLVHVCAADGDPVEMGLEQRKFHAFVQPLQERYPQVPMTMKLLCGDNPYEILEHLDKQFQYDLLIIVKRAKGFLEGLFSRSLPKNMAFATTHPLLILPVAKS